MTRFLASMTGPRLVLAAFALVLVALPLAVHKPGLPASLKADEPAYFLSALSLVYDFDLRVEEQDLRRMFEDYPYLPGRNVIVMSDDGWNTLYFGKPYLVSFLAAPFVAVFGSDGFVVFNALLFVAMLAMGYAWLARTAPAWLAAFFTAGFFFLGTMWIYVFWIHPEMLCMFGTCACLFFGLAAADHLEGRRWPLIERIGTSAALAVSASALALGVYNKPMLAALGLPVLAELAFGRRFKAAALWIAAAVVSMAAICGVSMVLTGQPTAYLTELRNGYPVYSPADQMVEPLPEPEPEPEPAPVPEPEPVPEIVDADGASDDGAVGNASENAAGWWWLLRWPETKGFELREDIVYFFFGRHTGLFLYTPFVLLSIVLFLLHGRDRRGWLILGAAFLVGAIFMIWIPFNWHGGGGFVGNRYFVMVIPAFLFVVRTIRPAALVAVFWAVAALFVGPLVLTPYGQVVPAGTLQAHVRGAAFQAFPLDFALENIPGYDGSVQSKTWVWGRRDQMRRIENLDPEPLWLRGAGPLDLWIHTDWPLERAIFDLRSPVEGNPTTLRLGDEVRHLELGDAWTRVVIEDVEPMLQRRDRVPGRYFEFFDMWIYHVEIEIENGRLPTWGGGDDGPFFYQGAEMYFRADGKDLGDLGPGETVSQSSLQ